MISHGAKNSQTSSNKYNKYILNIDISPDCIYFATGGLDRHFHLWDTRM